MILYVFARGLAERVTPGVSISAEDVFAAVEMVYKKVKGAYSVVATLPDGGMGAFRDPFGIKPICFGEKLTEKGVSYACASESVVLDITGYARTIDIGPGEVVFVDKGRKIHTRKLTDKPHRPCIFELVYFARHDSMLDDISVYKTRIRFGQALATQWRDSGAPTPDVVIPIPDSSRDAAMAMAGAVLSATDICLNAKSRPGSARSGSRRHVCVTAILVRRVGASISPHRSCHAISGAPNRSRSCYPGFT